MVAVDYADLLKVTLPWNRHHFTDVCVVTTFKDTTTLDVAESNNARWFRTNSFYDDGAFFNKWKALEEGIEWFLSGRNDDWLCIMDADVLWPKQVHLERFLRVGYLYGPRRRMAPWPLPIIPQEEEWEFFPLHRQEREIAGYSQIFHTSDPMLSTCGNCGCPKRVHTDYHGAKSYCHGNCEGKCSGFTWHQTDWKHAGGADSFFQAKWPPENRIRPPFEVLHLGDAGQNWCGRVSQRADGTIPDRAEERARQLQAMLAARAGKRWGDRFKHERLSTEQKL